MRFRIAIICLGYVLFSCMADYSLADAPSEIIYLGDRLDMIRFARQDWGKLGINVEVMATDSITTTPLGIAGESYRRGLGTHANSEIIVDLGGMYSAFRAVVGCQALDSGSVVFEVHGDDKMLYSSGPMKGGDPARSVDVPVDSIDELRLVVTDGGDGFSSDMANWADARLVPGNSGSTGATPARVNIAPFGEVVTSDPSRMQGTGAGRLEEYLEEDLALDRPLAPDVNGRYIVPRSSNGRGCLGLKWSRQRLLTRLEVDLEVNDVKAQAEGIEVQGWINNLGAQWGSDSDFQGQWEKLDGIKELQGNRLSFDVVQRSPEDISSREIRKVRWIFPAGTDAITVGNLAAYTSSSWASDAFVFQVTSSPDSPAIGQIEIENGEIVTIPGEPDAIRREWDVTRPLTLDIRYCRTRSYNRSDQTAVRLTVPEGTVTFSIDDLLSQPAIFLPGFNLFATRKSTGLTSELYAQQIAGRSTVLEAVERESDQDFASALRAVHLAAHDERPMVVSLACDNTKIEVQKDGILQFDSIPDQAERPDRSSIESGYYLDYRFGIVPKFGSGKDQVPTRHLIGDWMPIPESVFREGEVSYRQRTFVAPVDDSLTEAPPLARIGQGLGIVEYVIENHELAPTTVTLQLTFLADRSKKQQIRADLMSVPEGYVARCQDELMAFVDLRQAGALKTQPDNGVLSFTATLGAGAATGIRVYLPLRVMKPDEYGHIEISDGLLERTQRFWRNVMSDAMTIDIPDPMMSNVIKAAQVHCLIAARSEADGQRIAPWIAEFLYGPLDSESQAIIRGMQFMGHETFARRSLDFFLARFKPEGYMTHGYTLMGTGQHLWTLAEFYDLYHDREWLNQAAPKMRMGCDWIVRQRHKTLGLADASGAKRPEAGLLPPGAVADQPAFVYSFFANGYYYAGLQQAARVLLETGDEQARAWLTEADAYRSSILSALAWMQSHVPVVPLRNGTWVPPCAGTVHGREPGIYYGQDEALVELAPQVLTAQGVLPPQSRQIREMMNYLEDEHYLPADPASGRKVPGAGHNPRLYDWRDWFGTGGFSRFQPYYGRTAEVYALMDRVKPFIRTYFNTVASCLNTEALYQTENPWGSTAYAKTHETGYFLYQTRLMYAMERGEDLWLSPFVPSHWLKDGLRVGIANAPTFFGKTGYRITSHVDDGYIDAHIDVPTRQRPRAIVLRLRHPDGQRIERVEVNGRDHSGFDPAMDTVTLPCDEDVLDVRAIY